MNISLPGAIKAIAKRYRDEGYQCYLVGGAVRDLILKRPLTDFDIATDAFPQEVRQLFERVFPTGIKHGTVTVLFNKDKFEVTTFRSDGVYTDGRRPDDVSYSSSIYEDLKRRDFTINGIACEIAGRRLIDPHGGVDDLECGIVRAIGDPETRFKEDALRILRAVRIAAQLDFRIEEHTKRAIIRNRQRIKNVSAERIRDEIVKIVLSDDPVHGFELLLETQLLELLIPELQACIGIGQRERHAYDVFYHSLYACAAAPGENLVIRLAALLHDIGKAPALARDACGNPIFHGHDRLSARLARGIVSRLKFSNATIERVSELIRHHMFNYSEEWSDAAIRRFIARVGTDNIADLMRLRTADQIGIGRGFRVSRHLEQLIGRIQAAVELDQALDITDLAVNGNDLMKVLSLQPGPNVGVILGFLLESVLDDPKLNQRETLLKIARNFYNERIEIT